MRYIQHGLDEKSEDKPEKGKKKEEPRILAGEKGYDYADLGEMKTLKGGNPWS